MTSYEFYLKCQEEGITDLKTKADIARACLIAENNGIILDEEGCVKIFKFGKDSFLQRKKSKNEQASQAKLDKQKNTEKEQISEAIKISELFGTDKPIYFCQEEIDNLNMSILEIKSKIRSNDNLTTSMVKAYSVREKDWAIHGGIASGIAGGAAGVATALDIQQQNAKIREHNDKVTRSVAQIGFNLNNELYSKISKLENEIKLLNTEIDSFKKRLVGKLSEINLLEKLNPQIIQNETTFGKLKITVQIDAVELLIYDNVKATIDGSFKALLIDGNRNIIDEVYFYIPSKYGAASEHKMTGYGSKTINDAISYKIVFIPINLWAVETDRNIKCSENEFMLENKKEIAEYWKKDVINQQKKIADDLKIEIDKIETKKTNETEFVPNTYLTVGGISCLVIMLLSAASESGSLFCFGFIMLILMILCYRTAKDDLEKKEIQNKKMKEKKITEVKALAKQKENLFSRKLKEIDNTLGNS